MSSYLFRFLKTEIEHNRLLTLTIDIQHFTDEELHMLGLLLENNTSVYNVSINSNKTFDIVSIMTILEVLSKNKNVKVLNIGTFNLDIDQLTKLLKSNKAIKILSLSSSHFGLGEANPSIDGFLQKFGRKYQS